MTLSGPRKHIMILTGEPSGDAHAGRLIREIRELDVNIYISGIGGSCLKAQRVDLFYDIANLSAMGVTEVLMQFKHIKKAFDLFKDKLRHQQPDLLILVDYPGFNLKAAAWAKKYYNVPVLYYILPKVWAWKKSRLKSIRRVVDHAALIFPFEINIYKKAGIRFTYVGNPLMDEYPEILNDQHAMQKSDTGEQARQTTTIGLLPGSRKAEIKNLLPAMLGAAIKIQDRYQSAGTSVRFLVSQAPSVSDQLMLPLLEDTASCIRIERVRGPVQRIFKEADLLIAASGTVTLEAALSGTPTILIYKMATLSYMMARLLVKLPYAGLANLIAGDEVQPELLQHDATPEKITDKTLEMLACPARHQTRLALVRKRLGFSGLSYGAPGASSHGASPGASNSFSHGPSNGSSNYSSRRCAKIALAMIRTGSTFDNPY